MDKPELKPGMPLNIVFANEISKADARHMKAVAYDCDGNTIIISQTSPALTSRFLNRRMVITFLKKIENRVLRFGFPAQLINLVGNYSLSENQIVEALIIKRKSDPEPTDFRMYFRVKPPADADVAVFMAEQKVSLLDISIGGAKFICPPKRSFNQGDLIEFKLIIGTQSFNVNGVVRYLQNLDSSSARKNLQYVGVEFNLDKRDMEIALGKAILDIERSLLSKGKV